MRIENYVFIYGGNMLPPLGVQKIVEKLEFREEP